MTVELPPPRWAVPGLLAEGLNLLIGAPKLGKSWLALNIALAVAQGGAALGSVDVDQGDVLYLALEDTARRLQSRLRRIMQDAPWPAALHFELEWPQLDQGGEELLDGWLAEHSDCRLVVTDTFGDVRARGGDGYMTDKDAMQPFKRLADKHSVSQLVVHHDRKAEADDFVHKVSGTNGIAAPADGILVLGRKRHEMDGKIQVTGRDIEEAEIALRWNSDVGSWTILGDAAEYGLGDVRRQILDALRDRGPMTPKQLAEATGGKYEAVKKTARRMSDDGQIAAGTGGVYSALSPVSLVSLDPQNPALEGLFGEGHEAA